VTHVDRGAILTLPIERAMATRPRLRARAGWFASCLPFAF
jgi:hypothetical protein